MSHPSTRIPLLLSCLLALGPGCRPAEPRSVDASTVAAAEPTPEVDATPGAVMRSYETPPGRAQELANVLHSVLRGTKEVPGIGKVTAVDGDRVIVVAPPGIHSGVEQLCEELGKQGAAHRPRSIEISYWLVEARPAETTDTSAVPELADALAEVAATEGPTRFSLYERARLASMLNSEGKTSGARAEFEQVAAAHESGIVADLEVKLRRFDGDAGLPSNRLRTRIAVEPGKTVVIGSNGVNGDDTRLLYVMRAELVDA